MLKDFADYVVYGLIGLKPEAHLGQALNFFIYDSVKIFILLSAIIFLVAILRSFFPPERTRRILSHKREYIGNGLSGLLGIVTPFVRARLSRSSSVSLSQESPLGSPFLFSFLPP